MKRVLRYLKPYRGRLLLAALLISVSTLCDLLLPTLMSDILNRGIQAGDFGYVLRCCGKMLAVAAISLSCILGGMKLSAEVVAGFCADLRFDIFRKVNTLSFEEFGSLGTAALVTRATHDVETLSWVASMLCGTVATIPMLFIGGFGDHQVGMYLASGVLAALYRARETGIGDRVVVSLFHSAIWDVSLLLQASQYGDPTTQYPLSRRTLPNPLVVAHKTKDNKWLQIAMPQYNRHYPIFMNAIGHPELAEDPRYYPQTNLQANIEEFYDFLVAEMASRTLDEWCKLMDANDLPYAVAQTWDQLLVDKQAWASGCFYEMEYSNGNKRTMVRPPVIFEETELPPYNRGPYLGEQTELVLKNLGYTDEQVAAMIAAGEAVPMDPSLKD